MRLKLNNDNYITGYGCFGNPDYPEYEWIDKPEIITDDMNQPLYFYDAESQKVIYKPQLYSIEQTEQLRKEWCQAEIRKNSSAEDEIKILRENMINITSGQGDTREFSDYNSNVKNIIKESKIKNFQIEEAKNENQNNF